MKQFYKYVFLSIIAAFIPLVSLAEGLPKEKKYCPLFTAVELQTGSSRWIETPLSDLSYKGYNLSVGVEMMRAFGGESKWIQQHNLWYNYGMGTIAISGVGSSSYHLASYTFGLMHHSTVASRLRIYYGGDLLLSGGVVFNGHGGNNSFTVKSDVSLGVTAMAVYDFDIVKLPVTVRYQFMLPVIGTFSQLEYGELTETVFQGMRLGAWNNRFDMTNRLHLDLHFATWALRVGYHNDIITHYATDNRYQLITHNFVLGFAGDLMRWSEKNKSRTIKPALYIH